MQEVPANQSDESFGFLTIQHPKWGRLAQLGEHLVYTERVGGSIPSSPTIPPDRAGGFLPGIAATPWHDTRLLKPMPNNDRSHPFHQRFRQRALFAREVTGSCEIEAPVEEVWQALIGFDSYSEWNIFTPHVQTDLRIGSPVELDVVMPGRSRSRRTEWVNLVEPGRTICWGMHLGHPGLLCANRWQILRDLGDGRTQYLTVDKFSGMLVPIVFALYGQPMHIGFQSVADGLKRWVEAQTL